MMFVLVTSDDDEKAYRSLVKLWAFFEIFNSNAVSPVIDIQLQLSAELGSAHNKKKTLYTSNKRKANFHTTFKPDWATRYTSCFQRFKISHINFTASGCYGWKDRIFFSWVPLLLLSHTILLLFYTSFMWARNLYHHIDVQVNCSQLRINHMVTRAGRGLAYIHFILVWALDTLWILLRETH